MPLVEKEEGNGKGWWARLCEKEEGVGKYTGSKMFEDLETSEFRKYRLCTKIVLVLCIYLFMLYLPLWNNSISLFSKSPLLLPYNVTLNTTYTVITSDSFTL